MIRIELSCARLGQSATLDDDWDSLNQNPMHAAQRIDLFSLNVLVSSSTDAPGTARSGTALACSRRSSNSSSTSAISDCSAPRIPARAGTVAFLPHAMEASELGASAPAGIS